MDAATDDGPPDQVMREYFAYVERRGEMAERTELRGLVGAEGPYIPGCCLDDDLPFTPSPHSQGRPSLANSSREPACRNPANSTSALGALGLQGGAFSAAVALGGTAGQVGRARRHTPPPLAWLC
jgi:hypothetical protein